jgi:hypothetical protein
MLDKDAHAALAVAQRIEAEKQFVPAPSIPGNYPKPQQLITTNCIEAMKSS